MLVFFLHLHRRWIEKNKIHFMDLLESVKGPNQRYFFFVILLMCWGVALICNIVANQWSHTTHSYRLLHRHGKPWKRKTLENTGDALKNTRFEMFTWFTSQINASTQLSRLYIYILNITFCYFFASLLYFRLNFFLSTPHHALCMCVRVCT